MGWHFLKGGGRPAFNPFNHEGAAMPFKKRRVIIVTGSSSGIGAAVARLAAGNGYNVLINYNNYVGPFKIGKS